MTGLKLLHVTKSLACNDTLSSDTMCIMIQCIWYNMNNAMHSKSCMYWYSLFILEYQEYITEECLYDMFFVK